MNASYPNYSVEPVSLTLPVSSYYSQPDETYLTKRQLLKCLLSIHSKRPHPGIPDVWVCDDCRAEGGKWEGLRMTVWRWRADRAFDKRDQYEHGTPAWEAADARLRKVFGE